MRRVFDFASVRMGIIGILICLLLFLAVPHTAMVGTQPLIINSPNHFRAEYLRPSSSPPLPVQADKPQLMAATYYSLQDNLRASISLNNKGLLPLEVRPTLFNLNGERLEVPPVTVDATSFRVIDLAEWAALGDQSFTQGSLQLFYRGKDLLLGAQIKIIDSDSSLIFDEQLSEPNTMRSSRLEGLWRLPDHNSQLHIAISNTSDLRQLASIKVKGIAPQQQKSRELTLEPHQTLVIDPTQDLLDSPISLMEAGGISITHSGRPGSIIARTMIANPATGYSSSMQFIDPGKSRSSRLHGAGLRLEAVAGEDMIPVITSRNISDRTATLRGSIYYTKNDGKQGEMSLREVRLNAGEVKIWEIREVAVLRRAGVKSAGLEFDYDTQPGSVMVSALSVSSRGSHVFHIPMLDPKAQTSSTGVYPFYLDYGSTTMVYIKNTTDEEQNFIAHLNYEGGRYQMGVRSIAAGETAAIDIRSLRDNQVPDEEGLTIPLEVERGQARWTIIQREGTDSLAMIGRAEHVNEARGMSSTYACQNCCGDFTESTFITPSQVQMQVGQSVQMQAFEVRSDCYGFTYPVPQAASWSSSNTQVATVSGGQVTPMKGGQVTITASWNSFYSVATQCPGGPGFGPEPIGPSVCCEPRSLPRFATATARVVPRVMISGAQTIMDGSQANFSIQSPDATPSSISWSFTAPTGAGNNPNVIFNPNNGMMTRTNGHWFALPDRECPRTNCLSNYNIICAVDFSIGFAVRVTVGTTLTVDGCWVPAGFLDPNEARVIGVPAMAPDANGIWRVTGMGTLGRRIPTKHVLVPNTSQFFTKTDVHEQEHLNHWNPGNLLGNVHQPADFFARIRNFTGTSQQDLLNQITADFQIYTDQQDAFVEANHNLGERLAYQVSDPVPPRYLYQRCGQFQ